MQQTYVLGRISYHWWFGWKQHRVISFIVVSRQGLLPSHSGRKWVSSRILFEPSWSKKQVTTSLDYGNYVSHETPALRSFIYVDVGEPTSHPCSLTGMMQDHHLLSLPATWSHLGHLFAGIAITSWRSTERPEDFFSESVVSHLVLRVSSFGVLVLFLVGFVLFFFWKTPGFLLSPVLQHVGIANQRQNVLMTVRASSAHGMSSKKKYDSVQSADPLAWKLSISLRSKPCLTTLPLQPDPVSIWPLVGVFKPTRLFCKLVEKEAPLL